MPMYCPLTRAVKRCWRKLHNQTGHYDCILPSLAKCVEWPRNTATIRTTDMATPSVTISDTLTLHISKHTCILLSVLSQRHHHSTSQPAKAVAASLQSFFPSPDSTFLKPLLSLKPLHLHQFIPSTVEKVPKSFLGYLNISL